MIQPLRGWGGLCILYPGFHPGLLMFNPFRIVQAGKTLSMTPTDSPIHKVVEIYRLYPGLFLFRFVVPNPTSCIPQARRA
ncbi:MAG: hypothetical protein KA161_09715 [Saprospiraceae bacterium]|nr:hypothetical protein [Saprospiraceae bacterium]